MEEEKKIKGKNIWKILLGVILAIVIIIGAFVIYDKATINTEYNKDQKNINIPIFVYHNIVQESSEIQYDYMQTTVDTFEKQIRGLLQDGYRIISFDDLVAYQKGEKSLTKKTCMITFDDGCLGVYENAMPIIQKYKIPVTMFVINENVGTNGTFTWEQAKQMEETGLVTIGSHSPRHAYYDKETAETLLQDTTQSFTQIEQELGQRKQKIFCYPYGLHTKEQIQILANEGIIQMLTDNLINHSKNLNLEGLHRMYPLSDPVWKINLKIWYRNMRYGAQV